MPTEKPNTRADIPKRYTCTNHPEDENTPYHITSPDDASEEYLYDSLGDLLNQVVRLSEEGHTVTITPHI